MPSRDCETPAFQAKLPRTNLLLTRHRAWRRHAVIPAKAGTHAERVSPRKFVQKGFRGTQIGSRKTLDEAIVNRCQDLPRLAAPTLFRA